MPANESGAVERKRTLAMAFQELFTATVRLRFNRQSAPNAEAFRTHMRDAYRLAVHEAEAAGYPAVTVNKAGYAVIAFLDESVVSSKNFVFANWSASPLQKELFPQISGETFFRSINELLAEPDSADVADVLEVFLLAILLGFRGRYSMGGGDELAALIQKMKAKIAQVRGVDLPLSPAWAVPAEPIAPPPPDRVRKTCMALAAASLALFVLAFAVCKFLLMSGAGEIHSLLR